MYGSHSERIAAEMQVRPQQVEAVVRLLDEGGTVPFIARYRKEATGSLDEVAVTTVRDRLGQLRELDKRRQTVLGSLEEQGKLSEELRQQVMGAPTLAALEDIYLPYRPKRRTRATMAREKGLEPLAELLRAQAADLDPVAAAAAYVNAEKGVATAEEALAGARDIVAEWVNEDPEARARVRRLFLDQGLFRSRLIAGKEQEGAKFRDYFAWEEPALQAPSHRVLAMRRGEKELVLTLHVVAPADKAMAVLDALFVKGESPASAQVRLAVHDAYKRLLAPSMETEVRVATKERADAEAIRVFAGNLRQLLLAPPLGQKRVLAIDPGIRTGCKLVCLDSQGQLLHTDVVFPERRGEEAAVKLREACTRFQVEAVAIGNGTGGRQTEAFVRGLGLPASVPVVMVDESGASVYSASEVAREELPDEDVTVRGAVSIGRRLLDPLAELVRIDPQSIGVGQYQHDVDPGALRTALDDAVASCVNSVGVEVNTASAQLLAYVSGLGPQLARSIVAYRNEHGPFRSRQELRQVPRLGPKAFEQAAGFLRVRGGEHPLDGSAVHPERYGIVDRMARDLSCDVAQLMQDAGLRQRLDPERYMDETVGLPTLQDILQELARPGRDPRQGFEAFAFAEGVERLEDLRPGMRLPGIVTNITAFGAFVDIGVHQDGLVHVSQIADRYVKDPAQVLKVRQQVEVRVLEVDLERRRISLSLRRDPESQGQESAAGAQGALAERRGQERPTRPQEGRGGRGEGRSRARPEGSGQRPERSKPPDTAMAEALRKLGLTGGR
ncbi:MAG: Tex family protein [Candidatus Latescibacterota bacterium]